MSRFFIFALVVWLFHGVADACTSAIVSAEANPYGRPLLWKHRDTSATDNKVEFVAGAPGEHSFVALFNATDRDLKQAWMGMNDVGFAVMNTASSNLKDDRVSKKLMDREGILMAKALKKCTTVDDFAIFLDSYPRPMGVETNFGVIDAEGNGAYFETNNHSYTRFDLKDAENGVLIRTNYSHSGRKGQGSGYVREANAHHLLAPYIADRAVTPEVLTEVVSRSFYLDSEKRDFSVGSDSLVADAEFIPRFKSTATIVIEGCPPVEDAYALSPDDLKDEYIMWTGIGYPPLAEILPVFCFSSGVPSELRGLAPGGHSSLGDEVKRRRDAVFVSKKGDKRRFIKMSELFNEEGTGQVQQLVRQNLDTYGRVRLSRTTR